MCQTLLWSDWTSKKNDRHLDVNVRAVIALKECGISHTKFDKFCGLMSMHCMHRNTYNNLPNKVNATIFEADEECMNRASAVVHERNFTAINFIWYDKFHRLPCYYSFFWWDLAQKGATHLRNRHSNRLWNWTCYRHWSAILLLRVCDTNSAEPNFDASKYMCQKYFSGSANAMEAASASKKFFSLCGIKKTYLWYKESSKIAGPRFYKA